MKQKIFSVMTALALCASVVPTAAAEELTPPAETENPGIVQEQEGAAGTTPEAAPEVPQTPEAPEVPEAPQTPETPEVPAEPAAPVTPAGPELESVQPVEPEPVLMELAVEPAEGSVTAWQIGDVIRVELEDVVLYEPITVEGDLELILVGENTIEIFDTMARSVSQSDAGIETDGALTVSGSGTLTVRAAAEADARLSFGEEVPGIRAAAVEVAEESAVNALAECGETVQALGQVRLQNMARIPELLVTRSAVLIIPATAELHTDLEQLDNRGEIVNDGFVTGGAASAEAVAALGMTGDGVVCTNDAYYYNNGQELIFTDEPLVFADEAVTAEDGSYAFTPAADGEPARLVLDGFHYAGPAREPALTVPNGTVIELRGSNDLYQRRLTGGPVTGGSIIAVESPVGAYPELTIEGRGLLRARTTSSLAGDAILVLRDRVDVRVQSQFMSRRAGCMVQDQAQLTVRNLWCVLFMMDHDARTTIESSGHFGLFSVKGAMLNGGVLESSAYTLPIAASEEINAELDTGVKITVPTNGRQAAMRVWTEQLWSVVPAGERQVFLSDASRSGRVESNVARHVVIEAVPYAEPDPEPEVKPEPEEKPEPEYRPEPDREEETSVGTIHNPDGSVTVTETNHKTGTVTETTTFPDGTVIRVESEKRGDITTTQKNPDGSSKKTVEHRDGTVETDERRADGVRLETETAGGSVTGEVTLPGGMSQAEVVLPVTYPTTGQVVVVVGPDGTETVVRGCVVVDGGLKFTAEQSGKVKLADRSRYFDDVPAGFWAEDAIRFVVARGLYNGTGDTTFSPNKGMTRGMLAKVLHNLESNPTRGYEALFKDVDSQLWCAEAVLWAADRGIVTGYQDGTFHQERVINREQLAAMLYRYAGSPAVENSQLSFPDAAAVSNFARQPMAWAVERGIVGGTADGQLNPKGTATRAQVAVMLMRFLTDQLR